MNLQLLCTQVCQIAKKTGDYIRDQQQMLSMDAIEEKGLHDFVTNIDMEAEKRLVSFLQRLIKGAGFITEENTTKQSEAEYYWIIDPLDGTTNYIHGIAPVAISIALQHNDKTILGVVYEISRNECFYTYNGSKAYCNDRPISVSNAGQLKNAFIATGFPYNAFERLTPFMHSLEYFMRNTQGVRRLGSAATDLAYVACGRFEGFYEYDLKAWDVAAGAYIVQKAGGKVCDFNGEGNYIYGKEIVASNAGIYNEFVQIVRKYMA